MYKFGMNPGTSYKAAERDASGIICKWKDKFEQLFTHWAAFTGDKEDGRQVRDNSV